MAANINREAKGISRREFLTYVWGASAALLATEAGVGAIWYALPHFRSGLPNGLFQFDPAIVPAIQAGPIAYPEGKFWLSNTEHGLLALSMYCVTPYDRFRFYKWVPTNHRFECPSCGSKFSADGRHVHIPTAGSAPRDLDRFVIRVETRKGTFATPADGSPVSIEGATNIFIDINKELLGQQNHG